MRIEIVERSSFELRFKGLDSVVLLELHFALCDRDKPIKRCELLAINVELLEFGSVEIWKRNEAKVAFRTFDPRSTKIHGMPEVQSFSCPVIVRSSNEHLDDLLISIQTEHVQFQRNPIIGLRHAACRVSPHPPPLCGHELKNAKIRG